MWLPYNKAFREDPRLMKLFLKTGALNFWKSEGYPDGCVFIEGEPQHLKCSKYNIDNLYCSAHTVCHTVYVLQ